MWSLLWKSPSVAAWSTRLEIQPELLFLCYLSLITKGWAEYVFFSVSETISNEQRRDGSALVFLPCVASLFARVWFTTLISGFSHSLVSMVIQIAKLNVKHPQSRGIRGYWKMINVTMCWNQGNYSVLRKRCTLYICCFFLSCSGRVFWNWTPGRQRAWMPFFFLIIDSVAVVTEVTITFYQWSSGHIWVFSFLKKKKKSNLGEKK